jgi:hypothetical protein
VPSSSSPKKRKAQGPQQAAPPPSSQPQFNSPPFSHGGSSATGTPSSRRRHSRQRSDVSSRGLESYGQPSSRHRHTESGVSPTSRQQGFDQATATTSEGVSSSRSGRHQGTSSSERTLENRQSQVQPQYERTFSAGPEVRRSVDEGKNNSAERDRDREAASSSRPSGKREDTRD